MNLRNGDSIKCDSISINRGQDSQTLTIRSNASRLDRNSTVAKIELHRIESVIFPSRPNVKGEKAKKPKAWIGLRNGSLLKPSSLILDKENLKIKVNDETTLVAFPEQAARAIRFVYPLRENAVFLSDLKPARSTSIPFLDYSANTRMDRNVDGGALMSGGFKSIKGIGASGESNIVFSIDPEYTHFRSDIAIDDLSKAHGSVVFRVYLLSDEEKWILSHESGIVRGNEAKQAINVKLGNAKAIALVVDSAGDGTTHDRANWLDARFEK